MTRLRRGAQATSPTLSSLMSLQLSLSLSLTSPLMSLSSMKESSDSDSSMDESSRSDASDASDASVCIASVARASASPASASVCTDASHIAGGSGAGDGHATGSVGCSGRHAATRASPHGTARVAAARGAASGQHGASGTARGICIGCLPAPREEDAPFLRKCAFSAKCQKFWEDVALSKKMDDCPICLESLEGETVLLSCTHVLHAACLTKYLQREDLGRCPLCRQTFYVTSPPIDPAARSSRTIRYGTPTPHAGITVVDAPRGARIQRIQRADSGATCGLRVGDVLTHLNGIPCRGHAHCVAVVDAAMLHRTDVMCTVTRPRRWLR